MFAKYLGGGGLFNLLVSRRMGILDVSNQSAGFLYSSQSWQDNGLSLHTWQKSVQAANLHSIICRKLLLVKVRHLIRHLSEENCPQQLHEKTSEGISKN